MVLFIIVLILLIVFYTYSKNKHNYWAKRGIKGPKPLPFVGNFGKIVILKQHQSTLLQDMYEQYPNEKVVGFYRGLTPILLLRDPELINHVMIKDFPNFQDKAKIELPSLSKLQVNLFRASGETWRVLRSKLTPLFSSKKIKDMTPLIERCVDNYISYVEYLIENNVEHEIRELMSKYTLQVIGSCIFGVQIDTFTEKEDQFSYTAKKIFDPPSYLIALMFLDMLIPGISKLDRSNDIYHFFNSLVSKVIKQREHEPSRRKDFIDLMIELKTLGKVSKKSEHGVSEIEIDDDIIAAQAFIFCAAGFDTSSTAMAFMVHELTIHQDVQDKVYKEICSVTDKYDGKITYEAVKEMTYLEMVLFETLRRHSVARKIVRKSLTHYTLPGVDLVIPKGTFVYISVPGLHSDKSFYDNPEKFDPDNFAPEKRAQRPHCTYLAFGEGPRNCIGKRFALIQSLMAMAAFLKKFKVVPSLKTKEVLDYKVTGFTLETKGGIWVKILKR